jgi:Rod binding domain-containing protein
MTVSSLALSANRPVDTAGPDKRGESNKIANAASQFEALMIGQMLRSARDSDGEGLMGTEDGPGSALLELGEQQFAQTLANGGGLGIAKMVVAGLESHANR